MASCQAVFSNALSGGVSSALFGASKVELETASARRPAFVGSRWTKAKAIRACSWKETKCAENNAAKAVVTKSVQRTAAAAALAGLLLAGQGGIALAETYDFNTSDEQSLTQSVRPEASGKANTRDNGLNREGPNTPTNTGQGSTFNFNTSDEQTLAQDRQPEASGKANTRQPGAGSEGPTSGVKRASSSQAADNDFPGRAGRVASKAKDAAEDLLPGQPGKALEGLTRGLRFGKPVSVAGLNLNTTLAAAFDFNTSDEQTLTQNRQSEASGKANTRDSGANREGPTSGVKRASSSQTADNDFPGRAGRVASKAKDAAEDLLPGQPGKAVENLTRGLRLGKPVADAGLNTVTTVSEALVNPREGLADARETFQSNRLEARRVSKESRESIMQDNAQKEKDNEAERPKTVQELVAKSAKLVGKVDPLQDGTDSAAPGQARGKSFY